MSVGLALLQHLVNLLRARDKTLRGALRYLKFTTYPTKIQILTFT